MANTIAGTTVTAEHQEDLLDEALEETFPASDPPSAYQQPPRASAEPAPAPALFKKLLVATDLSPRSEEVLTRSIALARAFDGSIDLVHVEQAARGGAPAAPGSDAVDRGLAATAQRIIDAGVSCQTNSVEGSPAQAIVAHAVKTGADLIILGHRGHAGFLDALFGDLAQRITQTARCAVMVVPAPEGASAAGAAG